MSEQTSRAILWSASQSVSNAIWSLSTAEWDAIESSEWERLDKLRRVSLLLQEARELVEAINKEAKNV